MMRTMSIEKLMKTLPIIQNQLDALLDFEVLFSDSLKVRCVIDTSVEITCVALCVSCRPVLMN